MSYCEAKPNERGQYSTRASDLVGKQAGRARLHLSGDSKVRLAARPTEGEGRLTGGQ